MRPVKRPCPECGAPMLSGLDPEAVGPDIIVQCRRPSCSRSNRWVREDGSEFVPPRPVKRHINDLPLELAPTGDYFIGIRGGPDGRIWLACSCDWEVQLHSMPSVRYTAMVANAHYADAHQ